MDRIQNNEELLIVKSLPWLMTVVVIRTGTEDVVSVSAIKSLNYVASLRIDSSQQLTLAMLAMSGALPNCDLGDGAHQPKIYHHPSSASSTFADF